MHSNPERAFDLADTPKPSPPPVTVKLEPKLSFVEDESAFAPRPTEAKKKKIGKDPTASTSFLHDPEREQQEDNERHRLIEKFLEEQNRVQKELCELSFTHFDGSNIRRTVRVTKDTDIATLLTKCKAILAKDFKNLASITSEALMFIK